MTARENAIAYFFFIVNSVAGNVEVERVYETFESIYQQAGIRYVIHETTGEESLKSIVKQARRDPYTMIVAVGGDGTVSEMVDGLADGEVIAQSKVSIKVLPQAVPVIVPAS